MADVRPVALEAYEKLAEWYAATVDSKPHNAYYERPATLSLLPDVRGKIVLDAGCGPGAYAQLLLDRGAQVVGVDVSPRMVQLARARLKDRAEVHLADLGQGLPFMADASFDVVLSPLVLDCIRDQKAVFEEFHRLLRRPGVLVFSQGHPFADYLLCKRTGQTESYFATELVEWEWHVPGEPVSVPWYRRPLSEILNPLIDAGFHLDRVLEPVPTDDFRKADPRRYEELTREPGFICIRALKA